MIRAWIVQLVETGLDNRTINRKVSSLRAFYKFLLKLGEIETNPLAKHKPLKVAKKVQVPFSKEELTQVLDGIAYEDSFEGLRDRTMIMLFYSTGIRRAELIQLKTADVDFSTQTLKVLGKRNKERIVPLTETILSDLQAYAAKRKELLSTQKTDHFFVTVKGNKLYETLVYRVINRYLSLASTKVKKSPHMLRHSFATHMLDQGADLNAVKELLGHASLSSTQVYTHNSMAKLKEAHKKAHPRNR